MLIYYLYSLDEIWTSLDLELKYLMLNQFALFSLVCWESWVVCVLIDQHPTCLSSPWWHERDGATSCVYVLIKQRQTYQAPLDMMIWHLHDLRARLVYVQAMNAVNRTIEDPYSTLAPPTHTAAKFVRRAMHGSGWRKETQQMVEES